MRARRLHRPGRATYVPAETVEEQWNIAGLERTLEAEDAPSADFQRLAAEPQLEEPQSRAHIEADHKQYQDKIDGDPDAMRGYERTLMLQASIPTGASTSQRSITCVRASTCAATRRRIRRRSTSAKRSSCSR